MVSHDEHRQIFNPSKDGSNKSLNILSKLCINMALLEIKKKTLSLRIKPHIFLTVISNFLLCTRDGIYMVLSHLIAQLLLICVA